MNKYRIKKTLNFAKKYMSESDKILDLGADNHMSKQLRSDGFNVDNTSSDLDENYSSVLLDYDIVTAFEILEHLVSPYPLLKSISAPRLIASVPLRLWFSKSFRNMQDEWDQHYHEFEPWQFEWLLRKAGWKIIYSEKWINPPKKLGLRYLLRWIYKRFYIVYAIREK